MKQFFAFVCAFFLLIHAGCFATAVLSPSAAVSRVTGKYRDLFQQGTLRPKIEATLGEPLKDWPSWVTALRHNYRLKPGYSFAVWAVKGRIGHPSDGAGEALGAALTFGLSEVITLPSAALSELKNAKDISFLTCYFDENGALFFHHVDDPKMWEPKTANKALEPTPSSVMPRAAARVTPADVVAHL